MGACFRPEILLLDRWEARMGAFGGGGEWMGAGLLDLGVDIIHASVGIFYSRMAWLGLY